MNYQKVKPILLSFISGVIVTLGGEYIYTFSLMPKKVTLIIWMGVNLFYATPWIIAVITCLFAYKVIITNRLTAQMDKIKAEANTEINYEREKISELEQQARMKMQEAEARGECLENDYRFKRFKYKTEIDALRKKNRLLQLAFKNPGRAKRTARQTKINLELD